MISALCLQLKEFEDQCSKYAQTGAHREKHLQTRGSFLLRAQNFWLTHDQPSLAVPSVAYGKKTAVEHLDVVRGHFNFDLFGKLFDQPLELQVRKFGRFPHRNAAKGRTSTPDELEWLASPDLPGFAKSQLPAH